MSNEMKRLLENYQWMFRHGRHLLSATDQTGRFYDVSEAFAQRLGYRRQALLNKSPLDIATESGAALLESTHLSKLSKLGEVRPLPIEYFASNGEIVELLVESVSSDVDEQDNYLTVSRYQEIDNWAKINHRFLTLYRATPAMLHTLDMDGNIIEVSDRWLHKLGYERKEVLGRYIGEFYTDETQAQLEGGRLVRLHFAEEYTNHEREMVCKNGEILEVLVSVSRVTNRRGEAIRMQVAIKDVTDRNKALRELQITFAENMKLRKELELERDYLRETVSVSMNYGQIVGSSKSLQVMLGRVEAVARTSANVLIIGESGTGKELVSHAIHARSQRKDKPLVAVNCASIPHELFESEFFGHVKGAFTGATRDRIGRFQLANGGTIFLDEVGEIPLDLQGKLLRVLQQQEFERVGDDKTRKINVRIIAATNRDLAGEVAAGRFREDLFYRLNVFPIHVPPLRERGDDVVQLATHFIQEICEDFGRPIIPLSERDLRVLCDYDWPGNVRELKNILERAVILSTGNRLNLVRPDNDTHMSTDSTTTASSDNQFLTEAQMQEFTRNNLAAVLRAANGKVSGQNGAAQLLGIKPTTLTDRLRSHGLKASQYKNSRERESTIR